MKGQGWFSDSEMNFVVGVLMDLVAWDRERSAHSRNRGIAVLCFTLVVMSLTAFAILALIDYFNLPIRYIRMATAECVAELVIIDDAERYVPCKTITGRHRTVEVSGRWQPPVRKN